MATPSSQPQTFQDLFRILSFVPKKYKNIRYFYINHHKLVKSAFIVTEFDQVICLDNYYKADITESDWYIFEPLCNKKIVGFYEGNYCMFARSKDNLIYSWGRNNYGQLARTTLSRDKENNPVGKVDFFDDKQIVMISCGSEHCLALSSSGQVYGWGCDSQDQLTGKRSDQVIYPPLLLDFRYGIDSKVKFIDTYNETSLFVTIDGRVMARGLCFDNISFRLDNIVQAMIYSRFVYFLNDQGQVIVYELNQNQFIELLGFPEKVESMMKIDYQLYYQYESLLMETDNMVIFYNYKKNIAYPSTEHKNIFEYLALVHQNTCRNIEVENNERLYVSDVMVNDNYQIGNDKETLLLFERRLVFTCTLVNPLLTLREPASKLEEFKFFNDLSQTYTCGVKCCYVSGRFTMTNYFAFIVLHDDNVFAIGQNENDKLGISNCYNLDHYVKIEDLSQKGIEEFYEGFDCMFARTTHGDIYGWGRNDKGQLCLNQTNGELEVVVHTKIEILSKMSVVYITCGYWQFLALTSDGQVYGWGDKQDRFSGIWLDITSPIRIKLGETTSDEVLDVHDQIENCSDSLEDNDERNKEVGQDLFESSEEKEDDQNNIENFPLKIKNALPIRIHFLGETLSDEGSDDLDQDENCWDSPEDTDKLNGKILIKQDSLASSEEEEEDQDHCEIHRLKIKYIECQLHHVLAITAQGILYRWITGHINDRFSALSNTPRFILQTGITKAVCSISNLLTIYLIDEDGDFYTCDKDDDIIQHEFEHKIIDIYSTSMINKFNVRNHAAVKTDHGIYEIEEYFDEEEWLTKIQFVKTNYVNYYEYCTKKLKTLPKTIHMTDEGHLMTQEVEYDEESDQLKLVNKYIFEEKFRDNFTARERIGRGAYGVVYKVMDVTDNNRFYAIKKIVLQAQDLTQTLEECRLLFELKSEFVANYINCWVDRTIHANGSHTNFLFIQMDVYRNSLSKVIELKRKHVQDDKLNYTLSWHIFYQVTEALDYLHTLKPTSILHMDLKPDNILIDCNSRSKRFIRLADFGFATIQAETDHDEVKGTYQYMAPEVVNGDTYDKKADIYSMGVIGVKVFDVLDVEQIFEQFWDEKIYHEQLFQQLTELCETGKENDSGSVLESNILKMISILVDCLKCVQEERPECEEILNRLNEISPDHFNIEKELNENLIKDLLENIL